MAGVIGELRARYGWTQADLAARMGVTATTVGRWEQGHNKPPKRIRAKLAHVLGVTIEELGLG